MLSIDQERKARAVPFVYLWKDKSLGHSPYSIQNDDDGDGGVLMRIKRQRSIDLYEGFTVSGKIIEAVFASK